MNKLKSLVKAGFSIFPGAYKTFTFSCLYITIDRDIKING